MVARARARADRAVAIPVVGGFGRISTNPSLLPSTHYGLRLAIALAVVWAVTAAIAVLRLRRADVPRSDH